MTVPAVKKLYSVEAVEWGNYCELCNILCTRHAPKPRKYLIIFNNQNNHEKYTDNYSPFPFYTLGNKDFENLSGFIEVTKQQAYEARILIWLQKYTSIENKIKGT